MTIERKTIVVKEIDVTPKRPMTQRPAIHQPLVDGDPDYEQPAMAFRRVEQEPEEKPTQVIATYGNPKQAPQETYPEMVQESDVEAGWIRTGLPSLCVPYAFNEVHLRAFDIDALAGLSEARSSGSFTVLLDVLNDYINVDIRDLTGPDYRYCMYWWRINSYSKSPYHLDWVSRYGNVNTLLIDNGNNPGMQGQHVKLDQQIVNLAMTKEEYEAYTAKGICFPTVRDSEALQEQMDERMRFKMELAQYVYIEPGTVENLAEAKVLALKKGGIRLMEDIREFATKIEHGVKEVVRFRDSKFKPAEAADALEKQALTCRILALTNQESGKPDPAYVHRHTELANDFEEEAAAIRKMLEAKGFIQAREEDITLSIDVMSFFS